MPKRSPDSVFFSTHKIQAATAFLKKHTPKAPSIVFIGGSGIVPPGRLFPIRAKIPFSRIPHFRKPSVPGHEGMLLCSEIAGIPVWFQLGRIHRYEGLGWEEILFPIRVYKECGVQTLFLSNAAGAIRPSFRRGDFMMLTDHLNLMGKNRLIGPNDEKLGPRFPDLCDLYDPDLRRMALQAARKLKLNLRQGVYAAVTGPSYETKAEIAMLRRLGADAVGMSTAPEAIFARYLGMKVFAVSLISNGAAPSHADVLQAANQNNSRLFHLIKAMVERMAS